MKVVVDDMRARLRLLGKRVVRGEVRFYYRVIGYSCLLLVVQEGEYHEVMGKKRVALFNFDNVDGQVVAALFPGTPAWWAEEPPGTVVQCTVKPVAKMPAGETVPLSKAIERMLGKEC